MFRQFLAATAVSTTFAGAAQAQDAQRDPISGQDVSIATYQLEQVCSDYTNNVTADPAPCIEALEKAITSLAGYQFDYSQNRENIIMFEAFGDVNRPVQIRPNQVQRMGTMALVDNVFKNIHEDTSFDPAEGLEAAVVAADSALKAVLVYARADSLGVHPEAQNIGNVIVGLARHLQAQHRAAPIDPATLEVN